MKEEEKYMTIAHSLQKIYLIVYISNFQNYVRATETDTGRKRQAGEGLKY